VEAGRLAENASMLKDERDAVQVPGASVQGTRRPRPSPERVKAWRWAVPRENLKRLLAQGLDPTEIARQYHVSPSTISRAIRALEHQDLVAVVLGNRCQP
jgi:DNA-binding CsgD family transcriptional regulator